MSNLPDFKKEYEEKQAWGILTSLDIHDCDPKIIRDAKSIKRFVIELCELIDMKRFGEPIIIDFGLDERVTGFSMTQLIETSLISAHFANQTNNVYLDIFSCKYYDPKTAAEFAKNYFKGKDYNMNVVVRK